MELLDRAREADPANSRIQERLAVASRDYAAALVETGMPAQAVAPARRALELYESLAARGQLPAERRPGFAYARFVLGQAHLGRGNRVAACEEFRTAVGRLEEIDRQMPLASNWRDILTTVRKHANGCHGGARAGGRWLAGVFGAAGRFFPTAMVLPAHRLPGGTCERL